MRCITITYDYDGDDMVWVATCEAFINAVGNDPKAQGSLIKWPWPTMA
jgi:hypothetical protein